MKKLRKRLIDVASGREPADLVLKGGSVINVFTEEIIKADVAIVDGYIAGIGNYSGLVEDDVTGMVLTPGFMDAHMHIESSLLLPSQFEEVAMPHGTTAVIADPHEIANVAGLRGIDYMMSLAEKIRMRVFFTMSSCVPSNPLEEAGCVLKAEDLRPYYNKDNVVGLAEVMDYFAVNSGEDEVLDKITDALEAGKVVDGHAPGLTGMGANAYAAAGVMSDHECAWDAEAIEKMRTGQWIMIREGTAAKNLDGLLSVCRAPYCNRAMFATDDRHPEDLISEGHIDNIIRKAIKHGVKPVRAVRMATFNTAQYFGLKDIGAIAPGYKADIVVLSDLKKVRVKDVYIDGKLSASDGDVIFRKTEPDPYDPVIWESFHMQPVTPDQLRSPELKSKLRSIGLIDHQLLTDEIITDVTDEDRKNGGVNTAKDIIKLAVLERHHNTGHVGIGFLKGYGLKHGAVATSVAHDAHNLITAGTNDEDMALAAETVRQMHGGFAVVRDGEVLAKLALPIAGLMSPLSAREVTDTLVDIKKAVADLGGSYTIDAFMTLAFTSLPVIPVLRLNGRGLINAQTQEIVDVTFD